MPYGEYGAFARQMPVGECRLAFVDLETGGVDADSEILEVACVLTDPTGRDVIDEWSTKVIPEHPERISPAARAINGYVPDIWECEGAPLEVAMRELHTLAKDAVFGGHNSGFDWGYVTRDLATFGLKWPGRWHRFDTQAMAWPLIQSGAVDNLKLGTLARHFGVDQGRAHSALSDARTARGIYLALMSQWVKGRAA